MGPRWLGCSVGVWVPLSFLFLLSLAQSPKNAHGALSILGVYAHYVGPYRYVLLMVL